jgi:hypothetical protein
MLRARKVSHACAYVHVHGLCTLLGDSSVVASVSCRDAAGRAPEGPPRSRHRERCICGLHVLLFIFHCWDTYVRPRCQPDVFMHGRAYKLFNISIKVGIGSKFYDVFGDVRTSGCGCNMWQEAVPRDTTLLSESTCVSIGDVQHSHLLLTPVTKGLRCARFDATSAVLIHSHSLTMLDERAILNDRLSLKDAVARSRGRLRGRVSMPWPRIRT